MLSFQKDICNVFEILYTEGVENTVIGLTSDNFLKTFLQFLKTYKMFSPCKFSPYDSKFIN